MAILIVGQGVAGTMLAFELEQKGVDFHILDKGINHSSAVAAGIINPLVFRRTTLAWGVEHSWDLTIKRYRELEKKLNTKFFSTMPMRRMFASEQESASWSEKAMKHPFQNHITRFQSNETPDYVKNTFGQGKIIETHHVDVKQFLNATKRYFLDGGKLTIAELNYEDLEDELLRGKWSQVVFCQGYENTKNPFFNFVPINTTKGQVLTIQSAVIAEDELLNRKCFLLPVGNQKFRVGATYEWDTTDLATTDQARSEILDKLNTLVDAPFTFIDQQAGIRPTTPDRRPILGVHPDNEKMFIFNGLGTRGYLLAPWCARLMADCVVEGKEVPKEMDLMRWVK